MAKLTREDFIASLKEMTILEIKDLVDAMKEEFGVDPSAVAVAAAPAAAVDEGPTEVTVTLTSAGATKIPVIKVIRDITGLGLKEAKDIADNGGAVKEKISKEEAEDRYKHMQGERKNYGLYASYKYAFSDKFDVTAGIRGQHISEDYMKGQDKTKSHNEFVPQIQALYKLSDNISWYANAAKSYQLPPLNQFFSYPGRSVDDLKPQEGWTYETGIKHITDTASVKAGVYHMDIDAKFDWVDIGLPDKVLKNVGKFKNDGLEIEYKKHLSDQFSYNLGAAFSNPKTKEEGKDFYKQSDAKLQLTAGIDYTVGKLSSNLNFLYLGKRESSYYNSLGSKGSDHSIPHRSLLNANFTYKADEHHSASLTLNNLLDRDDTINKYENWGMPFNWMLTYNYTF